MSLFAAEIRTQKPRKPSRRERENQRQRAEIIQAALRLFSDRGYHNVSMSQIATEAEFGMGTLYKFFENKETLYKALIMENAQSYHDRVMLTLRQEPNPLASIKNYMLVRHDFFFSNLPLMRLYLAETSGASFNLKAGLDKDLLKLYDELIQELTSVFQRGISVGVFRELDPHNMALCLEGSFNAILWRFVDEPLVGQDIKNISIVADIFLRGALAPGVESAQVSGVEFLLGKTVS